MNEGVKVSCSIALGSSQSISRGLNVNDVPDGVEVVRSDVFVLQVVRVLPNVHTNERNKTYVKQSNKLVFFVRGSWSTIAKCKNL